MGLIGRMGGNVGRWFGRVRGLVIYITHLVIKH